MKYVIEKNVPLPPSNHGAPKNGGPAEIVRSMEVGDCIKGLNANQAGTLTGFSRVLRQRENISLKLSQRKLEDGSFGVWRIAALLLPLLLTQPGHAETGYTSGQRTLLTYLADANGDIDTRRAPDKVEVVSLPAGIEITETAGLRVKPVDLKLAMALMPKQVLRNPLPTKRR